MKKDLLKESIADAKSIREAALVNAKSAIEEAFTPKLKSMISAQINEELDEEYSLEEEDLNEVEEIEESTDELDERTLDVDEGANNIDVTHDTPDNVHDVLENDIVAEEEEISLEEIMAELELEEGDYEMEESVGAVTEEEEIDEEINLDELMNEFDSIDENDEIDESKSELDEDEEIDISEIIENDKFIKEKTNLVASLSESKKKNKKLVIASKATNLLNKKLNTKLNETKVKLSKQFYANKLFYANSLNKDQKTKVLEALSKSKSVKESELIYNTLKNSFKDSKSPNSLNEAINSCASSSKPTGTTKSEMVNEATKPAPEVDRWQKLAGIN